MRAKTSFLVVAMIAVLAACHANQSFIPNSQQQMPGFGFGPRAGAACTAPVYKPAAGPFVILVATGNVKRGTFSSKPGTETIWAEIKIKKATKPTPQPSTGPSSVPSPTAVPTSQPVYFYFGEYSLVKKKQTGCAFLFATQNGKPFTGSKTGALAVGIPQIKYPKYYKETIVAEGPLSLKISKLSANGGNGVGILKLSNGSTFDTAHVTLTYRLAPP